MNKPHTGACKVPVLYMNGEKMDINDIEQEIYDSMYKSGSSGSCSRILKDFRLRTHEPNEKHREVLTEHFLIRAGLVSELYNIHDRCRRHLARVELRIYYQLITSMIRTLKKSITVDRPRPWIWDWDHTCLIGLHDSITLVDRREQLLQVRSPRAEQFRHKVKKLKEKSREYEEKRSRKQEKEWLRKRKMRKSQKTT